MIKRTIYIGNPSRLHLKDAQLIVDYPDAGAESRSVPVEDIGLLVLDHAQISVTHGLIDRLIENNAAILWCDSRHLPSGLVLPMSANSTFSEKIREQISASEPLKKQLWKQTVIAKIENQAALVKKRGIDPGHLYNLASKVNSGDPENVEGRAAALYWQLLFDEGFKRGRHQEPPNNMLNYGYAVLRAVVARSLVASGMLPAMGIHHRNKYNPFCLADDIMEPYRPFVDELVMKYADTFIGELPEDLTWEQKAHLLQVPAIDVVIEGKNSPLMVGMQRTTASLMKCFEGEGRKILYPEL